MIKDIREINFPEYATLDQATATINDMGDRSISAQVKIDGSVVPDFSFDWEIEFKGERYIHPVRTPQGIKDNASRKAKIDLVFHHWAIYEMKRQYFVEMASTSAGTAIADKYIASLGLNLGDFVTAFNLVLNHYFGGRIIIKLNPEWQYDAEAKFVSISYSYIWDVLQQMHEIYGVRWTLKTNADGVCEILMGYPAEEVSHIFEYGFEGGLLSVQRQVQSTDIRNRLLGRGGSKNLPARYFKDKDPNNPLFEADPDWIPELANIAFTELRGKTFRDYVRGWKAKRYGGTPMAEPTDAYLAGYNAEKFDPIEYVDDKESIEKYGVLVGALENNEEIYPSIQGAPGNVDAIIAAEQVTDDDVDSAVENDSVTTNLESGHQTYRNAPANSVVTIETLTKRYFSVPQGKVGNLSMSLTATGKYSNFGDYEETHPVLKADTVKVTIYDKITGVEVKSSSVPVVDIPAGDYYYMVSADVETNYGDITMVTLNIESVYLYTSTPNKPEGWKQTFDIWVRNIWGSTRKAGETDQQYADRVWAPILGDRMGGEARVVFATGWLSFSSDWEFPIEGYAYDDSKEGSHWRLTLAKSEAELEASGKYIPYEGYNASAGDRFFFIGIDMPYEYVIWAEERLDDFKRDSLMQTAEINPAWVIKTDKVRLNQDREGAVLVDSLNAGSQIRLASKQFISGAYETLYVQSLTYKWTADTIMYPDVEVVVSDKAVVVKNPVAQIQSSIEAIQRQVGSMSNLQQIIRQICDKLYLRKDGISDVSKSPTKFLGKVTGENFRQGQIGGRDWGIYRDENGNAILEADKLVARQGILVTDLVVNEATYVGGLQIRSAAHMDVTSVEDTETGYVCSFDQKQGSVTNKFTEDDVVLCQKFDSENNEVKFYKRRVVSVSEASVTLSKTDVNGTGVPAEGDVIIHYGNYTDKSRQFVIISDVIGGGYERMLMGLDSVASDGVEYYFAGKSADSKARWFVGDAEQYAKYEDGQLTIKGNLFVTGGDKPINELIKYITDALGSGDKGLILGTAIIVGYNDDEGNFIPMAGLSGKFNKDQENGGPAAWYGGTPEDARSMIFMDGTGYFADGLFKWDKDKGINLGNGQLKINYDGSVDFGENIKIGTSEETLGTILQTLAKLDDYFYKTEDGQIGTKYNFFSEGEISANGMNAGSGGGGSTGGGLITSVLGKSAFGSVASEDNSTTFNAFAIDSLYKRLVALEGKNVDLSGYYTSAQTDSAIAAALVPYIKTTDADTKYAPLSVFNTLKSDFDALNAALNDDVSGKINTWNEIVDFLNEYSGSQDLATILSGMNSDIASRLKTSDFETWKANSFNPLVDRVTTAERNITKNTNAINSINSHMQGVDGTITAIQKQTDGINQRVETLETWRTATVKTITSLSSQVSTNTTNIDTNRQNIERIFSWFSEDADGNVFTTRNFYSTLEVSGNGLTNGTGGGGGSYPRLDSWANYDPAAGAVLSAILGNDLRMRIESQGSRISALEGASTSVSVSNLSSVGTRIATITIDGVAHDIKGDFLGTFGGAISTNSVSAPLMLSSSSAPYVGIGFKGNNGIAAYLAYNAETDKWEVSKPNGAGAYAMIHSGNIGEYKAGDSEKLGGYGRGKIRSYVFGGDYRGIADGTDLNSLCGTENNGLWNAKDNTTYTNAPYQNFGLMSIRLNSFYFGQLVFPYGNNNKNFCYRSEYHTSSGKKWSSWRVLAFTDSNVASATKLQTARTIWGQSFDGTGNVSGNLNLNLAKLIWHGDESYSISSPNTATAAILQYAAFDGHQFRTAAGQVMLINSSGNVLIGTTEDNGDKLQVKGKTTFLGYTYIASGRSLFLAKDAEGIYFEGNGVYWHNEANAWTKTLMTFNGEGNVAIGGAAAFGSTLSVANALTVATNVQIPINGDRITFCSATGTYTKGVLAMNTLNTYIEAPLATDSASGAKPLILIGWRGCSTSTGTTNPYPITIKSGEIAFNKTTAINGTLTVLGQSTFGDHVTLTSGKRLKLAGSNGIFLNNYGIHYQGASANDVNSIFSFSDSGYTTTIYSYFMNPASGMDVQLGSSEYPFHSLAVKQIKAYAFYKVSEATNAKGQTHQSKEGWYRVFVSRAYNNTCTPIRLFIARNYVSPHNESYVFDITVGYNGKINITQVSGINNADSDSLIDQIRVDWVNSDRFYIDFHKKVENRYSNQYMVWGIGDGEFQTPTRVSDTPVGTAYKFNTRRGFKQQGEAFFTTANPYSADASVSAVVTIDGVHEYATALSVYGKIKLNYSVEFYYHSVNKAVRLSHSFYSDGEISANGLSTSSDIRYKNRMNDVSLSLDTIANAPIFRYTWKHIEDGKVHLGTSAQYWLDTEAKELVSINNEDFHRLDYATLGVMMGVTLAKKAKSHEERIKELEMKVESLEAENRRLRYGN